MNSILTYIGLFFAAMLGGGINAIAGGGSLISFPALVGAGFPTVIVNATNTAALWPGSLGGVAGFWHEITQQRRLLIMLVIPSLIGGLLAVCRRGIVE